MPSGRMMASAATVPFGTPAHVDGFDSSDVTTHTLALPSGAIGDLAVISLVTQTTFTGSATGCADNGTTPSAWAKAGDIAASSGAWGYIAQFYAKMLMATAVTATVTVTSPAGGNYVLSANRYPGKGPATIWKKLGAAGTSGSGLTLTGASLTTDAALGEIYDTIMYAFQTGAAGSTPGFTYGKVTTGGRRYAYPSGALPANTAEAVQFTQSPTGGWSQFAGLYKGLVP